eukprot:TRINITY_DN17785_c0_g1_i3.p1 TRINITY_DN17785_c0_g1~~TRINITY_DN17785_c0_g1_i3.p1  ORF type:complete len:539 (-),score=61.21 TRINITY_DN17785_c0_g1_i3:153-1676(-)
MSKVQIFHSRLPSVWYRLYQVLEASAVTQGGLILMLAGFFYQTVRSTSNFAMEYARKKLLFSVEIDSRDDIYRWLMHWLSSNKSFQKQKSFSVSSSMSSFGVTMVQTDVRNQKKQDLFFIPAPGGHMIAYKGHWLWIRRVKDNGSISNQNLRQLVETLLITCFGGSKELIRQLIEEARLNYKNSQRSRTIVHTTDAMGYWAQVNSRPVRNLETVILPGSIARDTLKDCEEFLKSEAWYASRGVPYRRGYLLYGKPGTGKTSLVTALAGELGLPIYVLSLSSPNLNDEIMRDLMNNAENRCIFLLEDVDAAFVGRDSSVEGSKISFSGLLNAIDGVAAQEGRLLFMTTNHIEKLDSALIRPGRVDNRIQFNFATQSQIKSLYIAFYKDLDSTKLDEIGKINGEKELEQLGEDFSRIVPENQFSIADIQGYLMGFKQDPRGAIDQYDEYNNTDQNSYNNIVVEKIHAKNKNNCSNLKGNSTVSYSSGNNQGNGYINGIHNNGNKKHYDN